MNDRVSPSIKASYEQAIGVPQVNTPTHKDVLSTTEHNLTMSIGKVKVSVSASPDACQVKFRPVIRPGFLDFGHTDISKNVEPRTYEFVCECSETSKPSQTVECTEDTTVMFQCRR